MNNQFRINKCVECGHENQIHYKFCINCGASIPITHTNIPIMRVNSHQRSLKQTISSKRISSIIIIIIIIMVVGSALILSLRSPPFDIAWTSIDPNDFDWTPIEVPNASISNMTWTNIDEANYAVKNDYLVFLVKWNSSSRMPASVVPPLLLDAPHYLIYRKAYISWTVHDDTVKKFSKIQLLVGGNDFILFSFVEGDGCVDFSYETNNIPFVNETTVAFDIQYKKGEIPIERLHNISIQSACQFIAHNHYTQYEFQSLLDIHESLSESIYIDGNLSDWGQIGTSSSTLNADINNQTETFIFPTFNHLHLTRTEAGIFAGVCFSHNNITEFIVNQENLTIDISWTILISAVNGSFASDYAFTVSLSLNPMNNYSIQNVTIELLAGTHSPTISERWHLPHNQSATNAGFECFFPAPIVSPLYETKDRITFSTWLEIEWVVNS